MRIRRLAVPIAILSVLTILGGVSAGLIWTKAHVSRTPPSEVMVSIAGTPRKVETAPYPQQQVGLHAGLSGREESGPRKAETCEDNARTLRDSLEPPSVVEKDAGNGALVNGTNDGISEKLAQHGQQAGPVPRSELEGGPVGLPSASGGGDGQAPPTG